MILELLSQKIQHDIVRKYFSIPNHFCAQFTKCTCRFVTTYIACVTVTLFCELCIYPLKNHMNLRNLTAGNPTCGLGSPKTDLRNRRLTNHALKRTVFFSKGSSILNIYTPHDRTSIQICSGVIKRPEKRKWNFISITRFNALTSLLVSFTCPITTKSSLGDLPPESPNENWITSDFLICQANFCCFPQNWGKPFRKYPWDSGTRCRPDFGTVLRTLMPAKDESYLGCPILKNTYPYCTAPKSKDMG